MVAANKSLSVLSDEERDELVAEAAKSGLKAYDTEVWVDGDGYPVKMDVGMETAQGTVKVTAEYSDYGTKAAVKAPPADETVDFVEMIEGIAGAVGEGEGAGAGRAGAGEEPFADAA